MTTLLILRQTALLHRHMTSKMIMKMIISMIKLFIFYLCFTFCSW